MADSRTVIVFQEPWELLVGLISEISLEPVEVDDKTRNLESKVSDRILFFGWNIEIPCSGNGYFHQRFYCWLPINVDIILKFSIQVSISSFRTLQIQRSDGLKKCPADNGDDACHCHCWYRAARKWSWEKVQMLSCPSSTLNQIVAGQNRVVSSHLELHRLPKATFLPGHSRQNPDYAAYSSPFLSNLSSRCFFDPRLS